MAFRRFLPALLGAAALTLASPVAASAVPTAVMNPCGFYKTGSDAFYNHCTGDGSHVVIKVEVARERDYEWCVGPGRSWLGAAKKIQGAHYTGRTC
ncbi:DUF6355 family natural product biosynthesis protein [Streptomyces sp. ASQP_92]|uniref:DUF6355 family natural product biosynthesis protein n=1 Tax=unclassified Streptomyces TaxID=2593676 RepID=UPI0021BE23E2|nr:DUF6355 family natural product biosynthesis protein [Streptomyces sp. ASQP_92]MCT9093219.1 DUF6355 family natural product biosynthesis protein [Streptomyces sp. ASQP_92]